MATGKELRRRIGSIKSTQQITRAMKMVSAAKLRRAQEAITQARPYAISISNMVSRLIGASPSSQEQHPMLVKRDVKKVLIVLFSSDRGLCGGFNANLCKKAKAVYEGEASKYEEMSFACFGKRGHSFVKRRGYPVYKFYENFGKNPSYAATDVIGTELLKAYTSGEFDEIRLIFAEFKSALVQNFRVDTLLPIVAEESKEEPGGDFAFEPSEEEILERLLPRYFKTSLYRAVLESIASEHGARMVAMDSATTNAGDVIDKLSLIYNNVRQAGITKELLEITSGAQAL